MAMPYGLPSTVPPSARYAISNPLRREAGLRLLTENLPAPLRRLFIPAFRRPPIFTVAETPLAVQGVQRRWPSDAELAQRAVQTLRWRVQTEVEVARRIVEAPRGHPRQATRELLLVAQGAYLRRLYLALVARIGEAAALAEFVRVLASVG